MEDLIIRGETPEDYGAIRSLIVETFRAAYGTGDLEADRVERLRSAYLSPFNDGVSAQC